MLLRSCVLVLLVLAGCATPEQRKMAEQERAWEYRVKLQARCSSYGFQRGTDAYADCIRREHLCEQEKAHYQFQLGQTILQENRPGVRGFDAINRAGARTPRPQCY